MRTRRIILTLAIATLVLAAPATLGGTTGSLAAESPQLTVLAAASTSAALTEIGARFETEAGIHVNLVFASSGVLARQIANGAPADLFLSANRRWMDWLFVRDFIAGIPVAVLGNRLVLIQPADARETLVLDDSLPARLGDGRLAMGDPGHVPAGIYAKEALESLGLWPQLEGSAVFLPNVRAALLLVERGEAGAGIVYASDAAVSRKVRVAATVPVDSHTQIVYPAAVIAGGWTAGAWVFQRYLQQPEARAVFRRHGFAVD